MPLPTYEVPRAEQRARQRISYAREPLDPIMGGRRVPEDPLQAQVERQVERYGGDDSFGMVSLEGLGWQENYKGVDGENKGKKVGEATYEVVSDVITHSPNYDIELLDLLDPKLVMAHGHKVLWPNLKLKNQPHLKSMLTIARYNYVKVKRGEGHERGVATEPAYLPDGEIDPNHEIIKIMQDKYVVDREVALRRLEGHYSKLGVSMWYKKPEEEEPEPEVLPFELNFSDGAPSVYQQIQALRSGNGLDEESAAVSWEQDGVQYRATSTLLHTKPTIAGGNAKRVVTIETFMDRQLIGETVLDDISTKKKPSVEAYFNNLATHPVRPTNFRFEFVATPDLRARMDRLHRRTRATEMRIGDLATDAETDGPRPEITEEEAALMLTKLSPADHTHKIALEHKLRETRSKQHLNIKALQEISKEIGKNNILNLAGDVVDHYTKVLGLMRLPVTPEKENDLSWAVRFIAHEWRRNQEEERKRAADPSYRTVVKDGETVPGNPLTSFDKLRQLAHHKIGQEFMEYIAPEMKSWGKRISESKSDEEFVMHRIRKAMEHRVIRLDDSLHKQLDATVAVIIQKMYSTAPDKPAYDAELARLGKLLSNSVGQP